MEYRFNKMDSDLLGDTQIQNIRGAYIQDQIRLIDGLTLTSGLRYDHHPLTGVSFSPRASLVYSPKPDHALRASAGRAYRNPAFVHSYISMDYLIDSILFPAPINVDLVGNRELSPEWITSFELGYQGRIGRKIKGGANIFMNSLKDPIFFIVTETYPDSALFAGSPGGLIPSVVSSVNDIGSRAYGGEIEADFAINSWLSSHINYSYQYVENSETGQKMENNPEHKLNPSLYINPGRNFVASLFANYVSKTVHDGIEVEPYIIFNSVLIYNLNFADIRLSITNLLNDKHLEHPDGGEIGRSMSLSLTYPIN